MNQQFFHVEPHTTYTIDCISCDRGLGPYADYERLEKQATKDGWAGVMTLDEGAENYCPGCKNQIEAQTI